MTIPTGQYTLELRRLFFRLQSLFAKSEGYVTEVTIEFIIIERSFPLYLDMSLSRSPNASYARVDAADGTAARNRRVNVIDQQAFHSIIHEIDDTDNTENLRANANSDQ